MGRIREVSQSDFEPILRFADHNIGVNYFTPEKLEKILAAALQEDIMCSFVLEDDSGIQGIRLTYPPNQWIDRHPSQPVHPHLWRVPPSKCAYFQSLFIAKEYQGQGWGRRLSMASVENLRKLGTQAVVCHSWDESPGNSSRKYLDSLRFAPVISIANFWNKIDYECPRCGKPCVCTATEMILYL